MSLTITEFDHFYISLSVRREKKSDKFKTEEEVIELLEHFCTSLHGFVGGAFRIGILEFINTDTSTKVTVKIPYEKRAQFLQSMSMADLWRNERFSITIDDSTPFLVYL